MRHKSGFYDPKFHANRERRQIEDMLGEWYDAEAAGERVTGYGAKARPLGAIMQQLLAQTLTPEKRLDMAIRQRWSALIGSPLDQYAFFVRLEEHCAVIAVTHPAFLRELARPGVTAGWCARLNRDFPGAAVESVRFIPASDNFPDGR